jgi:hypothetical protein
MPIHKRGIRRAENQGKSNLRLSISRRHPPLCECQKVSACTLTAQINRRRQPTARLCSAKSSACFTFTSLKFHCGAHPSGQCEWVRNWRHIAFGTNHRLKFLNASSGSHGFEFTCLLLCKFVYKRYSVEISSYFVKICPLRFASRMSGFFPTKKDCMRSSQKLHLEKVQ